MFSLVIGLLFVGTALIWGLSDDPGGYVEGWPMPTLLIVVGVVGLVAGLTRTRGSDRS